METYTWLKFFDTGHVVITSVYAWTNYLFWEHSYILFIANFNAYFPCLLENMHLMCDLRYGHAV